MFRLFRTGKTPMIAAPVVALSVVFGAASGFIGGLMAVDYLYPTAAAEPTTRLLGYSSATIGQDVVHASAPVEAAARAQVLFFQSRSANQDQLLWPAKAIAAGVVLTSDGWLISYGDWLMPGTKETTTAVINSRSYTVIESVIDPGSGVIFLKVEATYLPVIGFNESSWLSAGEPVFAYDPALGPRRLDVIGYGSRPVASADELISSSDQVDKRLRLPTADGILSGTMILDQKGQVVAIFTGNDGIGSSAISVRDFSNQLEPVVRERSANRPFLGVHYVDLSRLIGGSAQGDLQKKGSLLVSSSVTGKTAVIKNSPAADVGLRSGDIILAVNGEDVSAKRSLSDLVGDYRPGDELTLTVLRGAFSGGSDWRSFDSSGLEIEVVIKLERLPQP